MDKHREGRSCRGWYSDQGRCELGLEGKEEGKRRWEQVITCRTDLGDGGWATLLKKLAGGPRAFEDKHREAGWGGPSHRAFGGQAHASGTMEGDQLCSALEFVLNHVMLASTYASHFQSGTRGRIRGGHFISPVMLRSAAGIAVATIPQP